MSALIAGLANLAAQIRQEHVRSAQTYMQIAHLAPDAQRIAHLPIRRAALELQCRDRDARQAAERDESTREWARKQPPRGRHARGYARRL